MSAGPALPRITLDDLVALNDEIAALARAGVPLDLGLKSLARDMPGRLGKASAIIGERLAAGESLPQILAHDSSGLPPTYAAVVRAGLRAGRLPAALEGIAQALRRYLHLRRTIALALIYPLIVVVLAWSLLVFWLDKIAPRLIESFAAWGVPENWYTHTAAFLSETASIWGTGVPLLIVLYGALVWYRSGEASVARSRDRWYSVGIVSRLRRVRMAGQRALFAEVLGVLLEQGTPLDEAVLIAGQTVGHPAFRRGSEQLAERIRNGQPPTTDVDGFPPLIGCLLTAGNGSPAEALRRVARTYHDDATRRARRLATYVPILFMAVLGCGTVLLYAAVTIVPWFLLLHRIGTTAGT